MACEALPFSQLHADEPVEKQKIRAKPQRNFMKEAAPNGKALEWAWGRVGRAALWFLQSHPI